MDLTPLEPGQGFRLAKRAYAVRRYFNGPLRGCLMVTNDEEEFELAPSDQRRIIEPTTGLIVQDGCRLTIQGDWHIVSWVPELRQVLSLNQQVLDRPTTFSVPVTEIGWPEPTIDSLVTQVHVLGNIREFEIFESHDGTPRAVRQDFYDGLRWDTCQHELQGLPLAAAIQRAIELLEEYVDDPAAALRARGFEL